MMTEAEWLCGAPNAMLEIIREWASLRKILLFRSARFRRGSYGVHLPQLVSLDEECAELVERFADGQGDDRDLDNLIQKRNEALAIFVADQDFEGAAYNRDSTDYLKLLRRPVEFRRHLWAGPTDAPVLRDLFGNPFRPIVLDPGWLTAYVRTLAQSIYEERTYGHMPILADALQDAGCDNADILDHCRQPGEHVRGCWVLDLILGRT
jgi:hypothetical protein